MQAIKTEPAAGSTQIRLVSSAAEMEAVARLRYEVYVEEMGRTQPFASVVERKVREPMDERGLVTGAFSSDGQAVGTLRVNPASDPTIPLRELYGWKESSEWPISRCCLATKLIVAADRRGAALAMGLIRLAYTESMKRGWRHCWLDANEHLVGLYTRIGFRPLDRRVHPLYGQVTVMRWDFLDLEHMRACRSPMLPDGQAFLDRDSRAA